MTRNDHAAGYAGQMESLRLKPFEWAPCWVHDIEWALAQPEDPRRIPSAARLLQRMQRLGVSKYHPDPVRACKEAEVLAAAEDGGEGPTA